MNNQPKEKIKIKILQAEPCYGLKRNEIIELEIVQRKNRTTVFFEPPIRYLEIYNEDWKQLKAWHLFPKPFKINKKLFHNQQKLCRKLG